MYCGGSLWDLAKPRRVTAEVARVPYARDPMNNVASAKIWFQRGFLQEKFNAKSIDVI